MTIRRTAVVLAVLAVALGLGHLSLTPLAYPGWTMTGLWFVGCGLAFVFAGLLNIVGREAPRGGLSWSLVLLADLVMIGVFAAAWLVIPEPQVMVGGLLFAGLAACALARSPRTA